MASLIVLKSEILIFRTESMPELWNQNKLPSSHQIFSKLWNWNDNIRLEQFANKIYVFAIVWEVRLYIDIQNKKHLWAVSFGIETS